MVSTSKIQGYELFVDKDFIYVNVGNPRDIYKNIVVLDPGHGGLLLVLFILTLRKKI